MYVKGGDLQLAWKGTVSADCARDDDVREAWRARPQCSIPIRERTLIVFSNQQMVHKVASMVASQPECERGFVAFFIVDPRFLLPTTLRPALCRRLLGRGGTMGVGLPEGVVAMIQEYDNQYVPAEKRVAVKEQMFGCQMQPRGKQDGFYLYTNGNGDAHDVCHTSFVPTGGDGGINLRGQEDERLPADAHGYRSFWL